MSKIRVSIAVPTAHIEDANQLAGVLGYSAGDLETFGEPNYQDDDGELYSFASGLVDPEFVTDAQSALVAPEFPVDMEAAGRAQLLVQIRSEEAPLVAAGGSIMAVIGDDVDFARSALGLVPIE